MYFAEVNIVSCPPVVEVPGRGKLRNSRNEKKTLRETQTLRALAVVRFGHRPPATNKYTDRTDYNTLRRYI